MGSRNIYLATSNFQNKYNNNLNDILNFAIDDYDYIEISSGHITDNDTLSIIEAKRREGKKILLHNYAFSETDNLMLNLCEANQYKRQNIITYIKNMIILTKQLGGDYYSIHGGFYPHTLDADSKVLFDKLYIEGVKVIAEFAEKHNIYIGVENHVVETRNLNKLYMYDKQQFIQLFNSVSSSYLMLHLDFGHLKVSANTYGFDTLDFVEFFSDKILSVHLHDNNGVADIHMSFDDSAYFLRYLKNIPNLKYLVIESWNQTTKEISNMIRSVENVI